MSYDRALELAEKIQAAGVPATVDPRSATPPCVLVTPPGRTYDLGCGYTAAWQLMALVPGPGNADAFKKLDELAAAVAGVLDVRVHDLPVLRAGSRQPTASGLPDRVRGGDFVAITESRVKDGVLSLGTDPATSTSPVR